jgi:hypothetical protein
MKDNRCCGSGVCIINAEGICWCGQKWDGEKLLKPQNTQNEPKPDANLKTLVKTNNLPD